MSGNTFGTLFCVTSFGESHGPAIGCVVDGCPPGLALAEADIQHELDRRRPGTSRHVTQRREPDTVEILSGVFEGRTTGTPIALLIRNEDPRSKDYANIADTFRPGHADYTYWQKYGIRDYRGGGRQSARETAVRVAAGAIARKWLAERHGVRIRGHLTQLGPNVDPVRGLGARRRQSVLRRQRVARRRRSRRSWTGCASPAIPCGARIEVIASGVPVGWGEPVYGKLDADLAAAMMSINAVKGVEIGAGFAAVAQRGTEHSDEMTPEGFLTNHAGGILGGISTGQDVIVAIAVKPTSSIRLDRHSIDKAGRPVIVNTHGRHDPCVGIRATPIAEAMLALVLMDHALRHRAQNADVRTDTPRIAAQAPADVASRIQARVRRSTIPIPTKPETLASGLAAPRDRRVGAAARERERDGVARRDLPRILHDRCRRRRSRSRSRARARACGLRCARFCASAASRSASGRTRSRARALPASRARARGASPAAAARAARAAGAPAAPRRSAARIGGMRAPRVRDARARAPARAPAAARCAPPDARGGAPPRRGAARASAARARRSRAMRRASCSTRCAMASRSGVTAAAAAVGVGARTSATKSQIVKSVSWPTPDTTGSADSNTARATTSSLNAHRSSIEPPPRPTISTSTSARSFAVRIACAMSAAAPSPCTARRIDDDACRGPAARKRRQDVAQRGGARRRDDADRARIRRQRALARVGEPAGRLELAPSTARISRTARRRPPGARSRR